MNLEEMSAKELLESPVMKRYFRYVKHLEQGRINLEDIAKLYQGKHGGLLLEPTERVM